MSESKSKSIEIEDRNPIAVELENGVKVAVTFLSTFAVVEPGLKTPSQMLTICILRPMNNHYPKLPFTGITIMHPNDMYDDEIAQKTALLRACAGLVVFNYSFEVSTKVAITSTVGLTLRALEKESDHLMRYIWRGLQKHMQELSQESQAVDNEKAFEIVPGVVVLPPKDKDDKASEEITDVGF